MRPQACEMSIRGLIERRLAELMRRWAGEERAAPPNARVGARNVEPTPSHADERTIRRMGEAELGGSSSEKSREAYERGENPGGLHRGARRARPSQKE